MNGDVEEEAPRPRPLSAGIWTLFSWLRRTDRSSSSESVSSVGSDRTVASFDFLGPLNYKNANTPLVLSQGPLTDTYKKRVHERNLRRHHDRDLTLRRKYGLFREEGLGYEAFSLPSARRLGKDITVKQQTDRERRATSESIQRRSAYVPGKRRAPLPPTVVISASLPRTYKRKRPAPKPPGGLSEDNKENLAINRIIQMNPTADVGKHSLFHTDIVSEKKSDKNLKHGTKEVKLRTDKSFLKQIFDNRKRNSAIDMSHIKLLPSISELDKQAAEIIEANKLLRESGGNNNSIHNRSRSASGSGAEDIWMCTTCLRKYKSVVRCCIYCIIKENSINKNVQSVATNASNICTQTDEKTFRGTRESGIDEKKKLREMLKEMKDSLPKRPKHSNKLSGENRNDVIKSIETPTLPIGSTIDTTKKLYSNNTKFSENQNQRHSEDSIKTAKNTFLISQPSSSQQLSKNFVTSDLTITEKKSNTGPSSSNLNNSGNLNESIQNANIFPSVKISLDNSKKSLLTKKDEHTENVIGGDVKVNEINKSSDVGNMNKFSPITANYTTKTTNAIVEYKPNNIQTNVHITDPKNLYPEQIKEIAIKDLPKIVLKNTDNPEKAVELKEKPVNIKISSLIVNNKPVIQKSEGNGSRGHDNIERIEFGNIFSPNTVNIDKIESYDNINNGSNILNTPLKISSLLNPLYCPKYKVSNEKVSDCNFGKVLMKKDTTKLCDKIEESPSDTQIIVPVVAVLPSTPAQMPSTSSTRVLNIELQKSEASPNKVSTETNTEKNPRSNKDMNKKVENNSSNIVKNTNESSVMGQHNRRRNLINQLEQAISKGDEQLAAEAATKLAKLKLSCSVLSFSSQIVAAPTPHTTELLKKPEENTPRLSSNQNIASDVTEIVSSVTNRAVIEKNQHEEQISPSATKTYNEIKKPKPAATTSLYNQSSSDEILLIEIWVEDKEAARGPIPLGISRKARIGQLKQQVEISLGLAIPLQRWIVGRTLCTDDNALLVSLAGQDLNAPFYVCLVEPETNKDNTLQIKDATNPENNSHPSEISGDPAGDVYTELMKLEQQALISNTEEFECGVCIEQCAIGAGAILRECIHTFCKECLADVVRHCEEPVVACPAIECPGTLQDREIRSLLSTEEHERWLARGLAAAESGTRNTFHCRTRDCKGWAFCEPGVRRFPCPVCKHTTCVPCQAVHEGETCEHYQAKLHVAVTAVETNQTDEGTEALLKSLISRGEALECPECNAIITKKWGCDWVKCSACKTEICWITKGRRWGPGGKGDTSGGCRCGIDGKRCHPSCGYCH